jgi:hypothetical protein
MHGGHDSLGPVQLRVCAGGGAESRRSPPEQAALLLLGDSDGVVAEGMRILSAAKVREGAGFPGR